MPNPFTEDLLRANFRQRFEEKMTQLISTNENDQEIIGYVNDFLNKTARLNPDKHKILLDSLTEYGSFKFLNKENEYTWIIKNNRVATQLVNSSESKIFVTGEVKKTPAITSDNLQTLIGNYQSTSNWGKILARVSSGNHYRDPILPSLLELSKSTNSLNVYHMIDFLHKNDTTKGKVNYNAFIEGLLENKAGSTKSQPSTSTLKVIASIAASYKESAKAIGHDFNKDPIYQLMCEVNSGKSIQFNKLMSDINKTPEGKYFINILKFLQRANARGILILDLAALFIEHNELRIGNKTIPIVEPVSFHSLNDIQKKYIRELACQYFAGFPQLKNSNAALEKNIAALNANDDAILDIYHILQSEFNAVQKDYALFDSLKNKKELFDLLLNKVTNTPKIEKSTLELDKESNWLWTWVDEQLSKLSTISITDFLVALPRPGMILDPDTLERIPSVFGIFIQFYNQALGELQANRHPEANEVVEQIRTLFNDRILDIQEYSAYVKLASIAIQFARSNPSFDMILAQEVDLDLLKVHTDYCDAIRLPEAYAHIKEYIEQNSDETPLNNEALREILQDEIKIIQTKIQKIELVEKKDPNKYSPEAKEILQNELHYYQLTLNECEVNASPEKHIDEKSRFIGKLHLIKEGLINSTNPPKDIQEQLKLLDEKIEEMCLEIEVLKLLKSQGISQSKQNGITIAEKHFQAANDALTDCYLKLYQLTEPEEIETDSYFNHVFPEAVEHIPRARNAVVQRIKELRQALTESIPSLPLSHQLELAQEELKQYKEWVETSETISPIIQDAILLLEQEIVVLRKQIDRKTTTKPALTDYSGTLFNKKNEPPAASSEESQPIPSR